jgi:hypothetical protein
VSNKESVAKFVDSLEPEHIYILCCWENTCKGANCHRKLLCDALSSSGRTKDLANYVYRHGDVNYAKKELPILRQFREGEKDDPKEIVYIQRSGNHQREQVVEYTLDGNSCTFTVQARGRQMRHFERVTLVTPERSIRLAINNSFVNLGSGLSTERYECQILGNTERQESIDDDFFEMYEDGDFF